MLTNVNGVLASKHMTDTEFSLAKNLNSFAFFGDINIVPYIQKLYLSENKKISTLRHDKLVNLYHKPTIDVSKALV